MNQQTKPSMSVTVVTPDTYATIQRVIKHLRIQNVRDQLEIVIVAPSKAPLNLDRSEVEFHRQRFLRNRDWEKS